MRLYSFAIVMFLLSGSLLAQDAHRLEAIELIQKGDQYRRTGQWELAIGAYSNAIETDNSFADAYMKRASLYGVLMRSRESLRDYNKAIALNPFSEYIYDKRSKLKMLAADYDGALQDIKEAISINPYDAGLREQKLQDLIALGSYEAALQEIDTVSSLGNISLSNLERSALIYFLMGDLDQSESVLAEIPYGDFSPFAHDLQGLIHLQRLEYQKAVEAFSQAIELKPDYALAYFNRALALRSLDQKSEALEDLTRATDLAADLRNVHFARALIRKEIGDIDGAIQDYNRELNIDRKNSRALYNRALTLKVAGDFTRAWDDAKSLIENEPHKPEFWNLKGNVHLIFGDFDLARESYNKAIELDRTYLPALYNRGLASLMSYLPLKGCADLQMCLDKGFVKAQAPFDAFCGHY